MWPDLPLPVGPLMSHVNAKLWGGSLLSAKGTELRKAWSSLGNGGGILVKLPVS